VPLAAVFENGDFASCCGVTRWAVCMFWDSGEMIAVPNRVALRSFCTFLHFFALFCTFLHRFPARAGKWRPPRAIEQRADDDARTALSRDAATDNRAAVAGPEPNTVKSQGGVRMLPNATRCYLMLPKTKFSSSAGRALFGTFWHFLAPDDTHFGGAPENDGACRMSSGVWDGAEIN
jgi:hypothetical protein